MHTDHTLSLLATLTAVLGERLREFVDNTCSAFNTRELAKESAARQRRQQNKMAKLPRPASVLASSSADTARKPKSFNLETYKIHSLGDYVRSIIAFGTTDSYSSQSVRACFSLCASCEY